MKKEKMDRLTAALESAGFELVSLKEETYRHLGVNGVYPAYSSGDDVLPKPKDKTGVTMLEITELVFCVFRQAFCIHVPAIRLWPYRICRTRRTAACN
jgi:hypothetical protein